MRFNEKELMAMAYSKSFTIQGILWKRLKIVSQYKDRFCRLKDNLLFYFTVNTVFGIDGLPHKHTCGDLVGVVVTENMVIQELPYDERHSDHQYGFCIYYRSQETDSLSLPKQYEFRCGNRGVQRKWMDCLNKSSFCSLRRHYTYIQNEFIALNVDLPPDSIRFQDRSPKVTFSNIQSLVPKGRVKVHGMCCSPRIPVRKLQDIDLPVRRPCTYTPKRPDSKGIELNLSCSGLVASPDVGHYLDVSAGIDKQNISDNITRTETIYNSSSPTYCSTVLLDKDKFLSNRAFLTFLIKQVLKEDTKEGIEMSVTVLQRVRLATSELFLKEKFNLKTEDGKACIIVKTLKPITALYFKPQKFYEKFYKHLHVANYCTQRTPCDMLFLNPLYLFPIRKTYELPSNERSPSQTVRAMEVTAESPYNTIIPIEFLKLCLRENKNMCSDLISLGPLLSVLEIQKEQLITQLEQQIVYYHATINELIELQYFFHASSKKNNPKLSFIPINLHLHKLISLTESPSSQKSPTKRPETSTPPSPHKNFAMYRVMSDSHSLLPSISSLSNTLSYVTMGAPTHHVGGFQKGSLLTMLRQSDHLPFFIFDNNNLARKYMDLSEELADCLHQFTEHKDFLMRTVANTAFTMSQEALTGLSNTMQRIFTILELNEVQQGMSVFHQLTARTDAKINQLPPAKKPGPLERFKREDKKNQQLVRHSWYSGQLDERINLSYTRTPSPGSITKRSIEAKLSHRQRQASILQDYIELAEKVDTTASRITSMREHLADASQQGMFNSAQIKFVSWSDELIPILSKILLKLNKLFLSAKNGLTLKRMQYESPIENYVEMLERHDVIMSQLVTSLVTSFAQAFQAQADSYHHVSRIKNFVKKCVNLGYLFSVESFLSVIGIEKYMLEDVAIGIQQLSSVKIRLICGCCHDHPEITGSRTNFTVLLPICSGYYKIIPASLRESDITVYPLLFSRSISCLSGQTAISDSAYEFIASVNKQSILALKTYYNICEKNKDFVSNPLTNKVYILEKLMSKLSSSNFTSRYSNMYDMELFQLVEQATRELEGGLVILCQSGKDRTGCAATLLQAQHLKEIYPKCVGEEEKQTFLSAMQMSGTRLDICTKNINVSLFAFNPHNLHFLPPALVPPTEVCGKRLMT